MKWKWSGMKMKRWGAWCIREARIKKEGWGEDKEANRSSEGKRASWKERSLSPSPPWQASWMGLLFSLFSCKSALQSCSHPSLHRRSLAGPLRASHSHNPPYHNCAPSRGVSCVGGRRDGGMTMGVAIQTRWKCWKGHLHWGRIIKTTSNLGGRGFGGLFWFHWRPAMVRAEQCSYRKPRTGEQCGMNETEENETGVHDAGISIEFLWWIDEWDCVFVSSTCVTEDGGGGGWWFGWSDQKLLAWN